MMALIFPNLVTAQPWVHRPHISSSSNASEAQLNGSQHGMRLESIVVAGQLVQCSYCGGCGGQGCCEPIQCCNCRCGCAPPHSHNPHGHNPHQHTPHTHTPAPVTGWPTFATSANLKASPWAGYYMSVYGELPPAAAYPLHVSDSWLLYNGALIKAKVTKLPTEQNCPTAALDRYSTHDMYQPPLVSWIWHPYPYTSTAANTKVEVVHEADPFGDEHFGMWLMYAPGSGIWFDLGVTISFAEHQDAYTHFSIPGGQDMNEALSKAAAAAGYDSIQFLAHVDHVNYQCDTKNMGRAGFDYMGVEVLATKLTGTYPCGTPAGAPNVITRGWSGGTACTCNPKAQFLNCQGVPSREGSGVHSSMPRGKAARRKQ